MTSETLLHSRSLLMFVGLSSIQTRLGWFVLFRALVSTCVYSQPSSFIVNAYYGDANGTTPLSTLIAAGATSHLTDLTYAFATSDGNSNPCTGAPTAMKLADL